MSTRIHVRDLDVVTAMNLAPTPPRKDCPALTPHFLLVLRRFRWGHYPWLHGGACFDKNKRRPPSFLTPFAFSRHGKIVWWIGDSRGRSAIGAATFDKLARGHAMPDGTLRVDGRRWALRWTKMAHGHRAKLVRP